VCCVLCATDCTSAVKEGVWCVCAVCYRLHLCGDGGCVQYCQATVRVCVYVYVCECVCVCVCEHMCVVQ